MKLLLRSHLTESYECVCACLNTCESMRRSSNLVIISLFIATSCVGGNGGANVFNSFDYDQSEWYLTTYFVFFSFIIYRHSSERVSDLLLLVIFDETVETQDTATDTTICTHNEMSIDTIMTITLLLLLLTSVIFPEYF